MGDADGDIQAIGVGMGTDRMEDLGDIGDRHRGYWGYRRDRERQSERKRNWRPNKPPKKKPRKRDPKSRSQIIPPGSFPFLSH